MQAIATSGSAGFDGWSASELKGLMRACPCLADDLVRIFVSLLKAPRSEPAQKCRSRFFSWRVVDIRGCEVAQLAIASNLVRAWNRAMLRGFPAVPDGQFCGVSGCSTVDATTAWLQTPCVRGPSSTCLRPSTALTTALLACAGAAAGVPEPVLEYFIDTWSDRPRALHGPRCASSQVVEASSGLPAGDPCSPHFLAYVLAPWTKLMETLPGVKPFAYMDDRSLTDAVFPCPERFSSPLGVTSGLALWSTWGSDRNGAGLTLRLAVSNTWASSCSMVAPLSPLLLLVVGRVWADHITLHPQYATAIKCLTAASRQVARCSLPLSSTTLMFWRWRSRAPRVACGFVPSPAPRRLSLFSPGFFPPSCHGTLRLAPLVDPLSPPPLLLTAFGI